MAVLRTELQPGDTPPDDSFLPVSGPGASLVRRSTLSADQQFTEGILGRILALLGFPGFLHHLAFAGPAGHFLFHPVVDLSGDDGGVVIFGVVHGQLTVVFYDLFIADGAGGVGFLTQAVPDVLLAGQDILDHLP